MVGRRAYDLMCRWWAPWDAVGVWPELRPLVDASTLDDLDPAGRSVLAAHVAELARPGAVLLFWCFYAAQDELPRISFTGPSGLSPAIEPGEEEALFGEAFEIDLLGPPVRHEACLLLRRRGRSR